MLERSLCIATIDKMAAEILAIWQSGNLAIWQSGNFDLTLWDSCD